MKILKKILIVLAILLAIPLIVALFVKNDYNVEREVVISKPRQQVFDYIRLLKNMDNYSKWMKQDPSAKKEYVGTDGTPGFKVTWDSEDKHLGQGEQTISKVTDGSRLDFDLHFIKPMNAKATAYMTTEDAGSGTKVKWGFNGHMAYPMNFMLVCMNMDKMLGNDLDIGLANLKTVMEK